MADKLEQLTNANQTDSAGVFAAMRFMLSQMKLDTDGMLPARVVSYDRKKNVAEVRPVIHFMTLKNTEQPRDSLTQINVLSIGGGGFHISFPIAPGDLGWIFASDRDLSKFTKELAEGAPPHGQAKTFNSGLFIPDVFFKYTINEEDDGAMVIQSTDGETRISVRQGDIKITAPTKVTLDTPMTEILHELTVNEMATFKGGISGEEGTDVSLPTGTKVGGTNVSEHGHEQNGDSGRTSGGMLP